MSSGHLGVAPLSGDLRPGKAKGKKGGVRYSPIVAVAVRRENTEAHQSVPIDLV